MSAEDQKTTGASQTTGAGLTDADLKHHSQELGLLGKVFGSKEHAPINVAGMVILICLVAMLATAWIPSAKNPDDMLKLFGSIALAALTFLGGYLGGRGRR